MADPPRLAILVIAHANPAAFKRLVAALRHEAIRVFVHLDARSDETRFRAPGQDHVTFLADRQENHWGAFTQVEVALRLFDAARQAGPFRSHVLISGDSLPLITNEALLALFAAMPTAVQLHRLAPDNRNYRRVSDVYLPHSTLGRLKLKEANLDRRLAESDVTEVLRADRTRALKRDLGFDVYKGSQWLALSEAHLGRLLDFLRDTPDFVEIFRYSLIADESCFQSAIPLLLPGHRGTQPIVTSDWTRRPRPFTLRDPSEADRAYAEGVPFFRNFADDGMELVEAVLARRRDLPTLRALHKGIAFNLLRAGTPPRPG